MRAALDDYLTIDGTDEHDDPFAYFAALQRQINSGLIWKMQGSCGRAAMSAIESGHCILGRESHRDYWGNGIPSRDDVVAGTKGSAKFCSDLWGPEWLAKIEAL